MTGSQTGALMTACRSRSRKPDSAGRQRRRCVHDPLPRGRQDACRRGRRRPQQRRAPDRAGRVSSRPGRAAGRTPPARRAAGRMRRSRRRRRPGRPRRAAPRRHPRSCSRSTRCRARSRSSSSGPNWIESVGQACAQAGSMPVLQPVVAERALVARQAGRPRSAGGRRSRRSMTPKGQAGTQ